MVTKNQPKDAADHVGRLRAVLKALGIKRGTFVDDQFKLSFDDAWARSRSAEVSKGKELAAAWRVDPWEPNSAEDARSAAEMQWSALDRPAQRELVETISMLSADIATDSVPPEDVGFFGTFWPSDTCPLDEIGPDEFDESYLKNSLLKKGPSILFLDLSFGDTDQTGGLRLLKEVLKADSAHQTVCVVFTHRPGADSVDYWADLAAQEGIEPDAAVVISKQASRSVEVFESELRRALLNWLAPELLKWAKEIAGKALADAIATTKIEGDVLNAVVLQSSEKEGVDPTETLFRIIDGESRRERDRAVSTKEARQGFSDLKKKLEALAKIVPAGTAGSPVSLSAKKLMRSHLYRSEVMAAEWPAPMWLGDLWEVTLEGETSEKFALVAQPCDIVLRSESGQRSQEWAILVPLKTEKGNAETTVLLPYFDEGSCKDRWADLKRARVANANVLDVIAMFGRRIEKSTLAQLRTRSHVHSSIAKRIHQLVDWLEGIPNDSAVSAQALALFGGPGAAAKLSNTSEAIDFHCTRVGRIEPELARLLLQRYGNFIGRHALPHDFAKFGS